MNFYYANESFLQKTTDFKNTLLAYLYFSNDLMPKFIGNFYYLLFERYL